MSEKKFVVELDSEAEYVAFMRAKFENEIKKIERSQKRMKEKLQTLKEAKEKLEKEFAEFKKAYPDFFRRGRKPKAE